MRALALVEPGGDHRATDCAVVSHDRPADSCAGHESIEIAIRPCGETRETQAGHTFSEARRKVSGQLHDDIIDALPDDFVRRMRNWARTVDGVSVSTSQLQDRVDHTRPDQPIPTLIGEAQDTHKRVQRLPRLQQEVVAVFWTHLARELRWMARATPILREARLGSYSFRQELESGHAALQAIR